MDEILNKANELGLMIKGTEIYKRFEEVSEKINADPDAKQLVNEYINFSEEMYRKEQSGAPIEVEEKEKLKDLSEKASAHELIKEYIATQSYFVNLMMQIQKAINEPEGEPIEESRIIKPNSPGKIITDI